MVAWRLNLLGRYAANKLVAERRNRRTVRSLPIELPANGQDRITTNEPRVEPDTDPMADLTLQQRRLLNLVTASQPLPASYDNKVQLYFNGEHKFAQLKKDIAAAENHIHLEYFIWQRDELGDELKDLLFENVKEGVEVRVLRDATGSLTSKKKYLKQQKNIGLLELFTIYLTDSKERDW